MKRNRRRMSTAISQYNTGSQNSQRGRFLVELAQGDNLDNSHVGTEIEKSDEMYFSEPPQSQRNVQDTETFHKKDPRRYPSTSTSNDQTSSNRGRVTDINNIWSRPLDMNDFPAVFDFRNEHAISQDFIINYDMTNLKSLLTEIPNVKNSNEPEKLQQNSEPTKCELDLCLRDIAASINPEDPYLLNISEVGCGGSIENSTNTGYTLTIDDEMKTSFIEDSDDSVKDKDYNPSSESSESSVESVIRKSPDNKCKKSGNKENQQPNLKQKIAKDVIIATLNEAIKNKSGSISEKVLTKIENRKPDALQLDLLCHEDLPASLSPEKSESLSNSKICVQSTEHSININNGINMGCIEISNDSDKDKDYNPPLESSKSPEEIVKRKSPVNDSFKPNASQNNQQPNINENTAKDPIITTNNEANHESISAPKTPEKGLTKKGLPRQRKRFEMPIGERNELKKNKQIEKLSIKDPCSDQCQKKCTTKINQETRLKIHDSYVKLSWEARGIFMKTSVDEKNIKTRKTSDPIKKRNIAYKYFFKNNEGTRLEVCKTFFLTTLGYDKKNDRRLLGSVKKSINNQIDRRGKYVKIEKIDRKILKQHVESFNPAVSHYRREHAPNKRYLPSDINVKLMHKDFKEKYPEVKVSYEVYRKFVKDEMHISFAQLGNEECELCTIYKEHMENHAEIEENCDYCDKYKRHKTRYTESRQAYDEDREKQKNTSNEIFYSADLQKIIMLPRMDMYKAALFCPRLIAFNESFVPLGETTEENKPYAIIWNESTAGRSQEDIISTFRAFLLCKRDAENIIVWVDNCSSQNKNWALLSFFTQIINSNEISAKTITIKYFEPGHTFMSADHFHHQIEKSLKQKKKVYDFNDFTDAVQSANSGKNITKVMDVGDFYQYEDGSSSHKIKNNTPRVYLKDIMIIKAERGKFTLQYMTGHKGEYQELNFLRVKILKTGFPDAQKKSAPRGISKQRKETILVKLCPLMPLNRKVFWESIPIDETSANLITSDNGEDNIQSET